MEKEFVPHAESLELKELGFDKPCFGYYDCERDFKFIPNKEKFLVCEIAAPTFSQAFGFFREKYNLVIVIKPIDDKRLDLGYNLTKNGLIIQACTTYEKAELFSVRKLIEIVKNKP